MIKWPFGMGEPFEADTKDYWGPRVPDVILPGFQKRSIWGKYARDAYEIFILKKIAAVQPTDRQTWDTQLVWTHEIQLWFIFNLAGDSWSARSQPIFLLSYGLERIENNSRSHWSIFPGPVIGRIKKGCQEARAKGMGPNKQNSVQRALQLCPTLASL